MRVVTAVLLAAIVVVVAFVGVQLRTIARELAPAAAVNAGILSLGASATESHEQRVQRILREQRDGDAENAAFGDALRRRAASRQR